MTRPGKDEYFMRLALIVATRATCLRRSVGCVLVDQRGHVLATGYNGVARGVPHCNEGVAQGEILRFPNACAAAAQPTGQGLEGCAAIHAEQNALLQCHDVDLIYTCYSTTEPCGHCAKLLLNTGCQQVRFLAPYEGEGARQWALGRAAGWMRMIINQ